MPEPQKSLADASVDSAILTVGAPSPAAAPAFGLLPTNPDRIPRVERHVPPDMHLEKVQANVVSTTPTCHHLLASSRRLLDTDDWVSPTTVTLRVKATSV